MIGDNKQGFEGIIAAFSPLNIDKIKIRKNCLLSWARYICTREIIFFFIYFINLATEPAIENWPIQRFCRR